LGVGGAGGKVVDPNGEVVGIITGTAVGVTVALVVT
jgi:hypothetical protein